VVDIGCFVVEFILGFFLGISFVPFDERLSDVEITCLFRFVSVSSSDIVDVTGTLSKSISIMRTFVGVVFFGIRLSIGLVVDVIVLFVFSITFGFTVAVGLVFLDGVTLLTNKDFRSSKSL